MQRLNLPYSELGHHFMQETVTTTGEFMMHRARRRLQLQDVTKELESCARSGCKGKLSIPKHVLQPDFSRWYRPYYGDSGFEIIHFDLEDMGLLIKQHFSSLLDHFRSAPEDVKTLLWSICAIYLYGGVIIGPSGSRNVRLQYQDVDLHHVMDVGLIEVVHTGDRVEIDRMAVSPRHPQLECLIYRLEREPTPLTPRRIIKSFFDAKSWPKSVAIEELNNTAVDLWDVLSTQPCKDATQCCHDLQHSTQQEADIRGSTSTLNLRIFSYLPNGTITEPRVDVEITDSTVAPTQPKEEEIEPKRMIRENCGASWLCNRCLRSSLYGSYKKCSWLCSACYMKAVCSKSEDAVKVTMKLSVKERRPLELGERRIPRIVHQTWLQDISTLSYPQLARLQQSWSRSGWTYKFYSEDNARLYVSEHFPPRFLEAFDVVKGILKVGIVHGPCKTCFSCLSLDLLKSDLFRYLVLLREGGIYADMDVLLETKLDNFVTPTLSFFAAQDDSIAGGLNETFCLWNGLVGSAPGHPFLARVVERVITLILNRAGNFDVEREMCRTVGPSVNAWKVQHWSPLLLSGPCALGIAVNDGLGRNNRLSRFDYGWLRTSDIEASGLSSDDHDALILKVSTRH